jgi:deazaflavin-dependent oxidoreductase (nitroreductase family)
MIGPKAVSARARVAEGEERERLWQQMAKLYPSYDRYQEHAGARTIPVVVGHRRHERPFRER